MQERQRDNRDAFAAEGFFVDGPEGVEDLLVLNLHGRSQRAFWALHHGEIEDRRSAAAVLVEVVLLRALGVAA